MAKSSRSKWKKAHRRQRAAEESKNVLRRVSQLNKKLKLTAKGGISEIPPQAPERRFHFLNPVLDPRVPNTSKDLNNNYRHELNHVTYDYNKPLKLPQPRTCFYGKSNPNAAHPMTVNYETLDADAPIAGRALTKDDLVRMEEKQKELLQLASRVDGGQNEEATNTTTHKLASVRGSKANARGRRGVGHRDGAAGVCDEEEMVNFDNDAALYGGADDGPEEFVLTFDSAKPTRVTRESAAVGASSSSRGASGADEAAVKGNHKIASMQSQSTRNAKVVSTAGNKKVKKMTKDSVKASRMVSSASKKASKKVVL